MDSDRFDALTRSLSAGGSRRHALGAALGGMAGAFGLAEVRAAKSGKCKPKCGECERCKKGDCDTKNGKKRCKKGKCKLKPTGAPCTAFPGGACQNGTCINLKADEANCGSLGTVCTASQVCQAGSCFPQSTCAATVTNYCAPLAPSCGSGLTSCFCARSAEGNVLCLHDEDELCMTAPLCQTSAECPPGEACVDVQGCCASDPPGSKRCLARCPAPAA
jgi:hypothetical protein